MQSVFEVLQERGFVAQYSDEALRLRLANQKVTVYAGFDPTANSLHLGHVVPIMALAHFQKAGHSVILLVGGATGMVGDPSGRSDERNLLTPDQVASNVRGIKKQLEGFLDFGATNAPIIVNNHDWIAPMSFLDWLREVGKNFTVNYMMAKDSVKRRLESEQGITYTEFSYMTMQAYDFLHLFDHFACTLQCGGSDQWGNIVAGIDLIHKVRQSDDQLDPISKIRKSIAFGMTFPLITTSAGEKFGKSAGNALWLDPARTSPWDFYQYLVRQDDRDVIRFLNFYTFLPQAEIERLAKTVIDAPDQRAAQKALAFEVTRIVHGEATARELVHAADVIYHGEIKNISDQTLAAAFASVPSTQISRAELDQGIEVVDLLVRTGLSPSKNEARRLLKSGGVYVNNVRLESEAKIDCSRLASESLIVLRSGKKNYHLVRVSLS